MATTTRVLDANVNGTVYTSNANDALEALDTCHSGATAPTDEVANGKLWLDTSTTPGVLKIYNNATWVAVVNSTTVDDAGGLLASNNLSDVASAATALSNLGLSATATEINVLDGVTASTAELNTLTGITATVTELNYVDGVTSNIQTQIDNIPAPPELTQVQVEDDTSTVFGQVSGQRLGQAVATNAPADQGFTESLGAADSTGYTTFPNGLIVQWGRTSVTSGSSTIFTLPIAFTTSHIGGVATPNRTSAVSGSYSAYYDNTSVTQGRVVNDSVTASSTLNIFWVCWGY